MSLLWEFSGKGKLARKWPLWTRMMVHLRGALSRMISPMKTACSYAPMLSVHRIYTCSYRHNNGNHTYKAELDGEKNVSWREEEMDVPKPAVALFLDKIMMKMHNHHNVYWVACIMYQDATLYRCVSYGNKSSVQNICQGLEERNEIRPICMVTPTDN